MGWPDGMRRGALLSAMIDGDSRLDRVAETLGEAAATRATADELAQGRDKRALLAELAASMEPTIDTDARSVPRARALLAPRVPRPVGEAWLADAPPVRRGFRPRPGLVRSVAHASRGRERDEPEEAGSDLGRGRILLAAALRAASEEERQTLLAGIGAGEAASLLALSAHDDATPPPAPAVLSAARLAQGDLRVAALGRVARGRRSGEREAIVDPMVRAGRELVELGLVPPPEER